MLWLHETPFHYLTRRHHYHSVKCVRKWAKLTFKIYDIRNIKKTNFFWSILLIFVSWDTLGQVCFLVYVA